MILVLWTLVLVAPVIVFLTVAPASFWEAINERIKNPPEKTDFYDVQLARERSYAASAADSRVRGIEQALWIIKECRTIALAPLLKQRIEAWLEDWEDEDPFDDDEDRPLA